MQSRGLKYTVIIDCRESSPSKIKKIKYRILGPRWLVRTSAAFLRSKIEVIYRKAVKPETNRLIRLFMGFFVCADKDRATCNTESGICMYIFYLARAPPVLHVFENSEIWRTMKW